MSAPIPFITLTRAQHSLTDVLHMLASGAQVADVRRELQQASARLSEAYLELSKADDQDLARSLIEGAQNALRAKRPGIERARNLLEKVAGVLKVSDA